MTSRAAGLLQNGKRNQTQLLQQQGADLVSIQIILLQSWRPYIRSSHMGKNLRLRVCERVQTDVASCGYVKSEIEPWTLAYIHPLLL